MRHSDIIEMVNDLLDEQGEVTIGNLTFYPSDIPFYPSQILRECDPTAYRITVNEYIDNMIQDLEYDLERTDDEDEQVDLKEQIAHLEDSYI